jgi:glycosyltransferase involved in cell wall biosynthesis
MMRETGGAKSAFTEFTNKNVLFISTKNTDYLRNTQEIAALKSVAKSVRVLGYSYKGYFARLLLIFANLLFMPLHFYDAVFVGFAPQLILPFFNWRFRKKLVGEDFFISLYDTMVCDRKKFKAGTFPAKILHRLDEITLKRASIIVADTHSHGDFFVNEFGAASENIRVVYLEADKSIYHPKKMLKIDALKGKFTVLYFGSILPLQGTEVILECIKLMKDNDKIAFDFIGPVGETQRACCEGCHVVFTSWLTQGALADRIAGADLCLAGHFNASIAKASRTIPGKAYIYNAMGKPMILGENPANHELFSEDNVSNFFVGMGDANKLKDKILFAAEQLQQFN